MVGVLDVGAVVEWSDAHCHKAAPQTLHVVLFLDLGIESLKHGEVPRKSVHIGEGIRNTLHEGRPGVVLEIPKCAPPHFTTLFIPNIVHPPSF